MRKRHKASCCSTLPPGGNWAWATGHTRSLSLSKNARKKKHKQSDKRVMAGWLSRIILMQTHARMGHCWHGRRHFNKSW